MVSRYYTDALPVLLLAAAQYACIDDGAPHQSTYFMLLGLCTRILCSNSSSPKSVLASVQALRYLFAHSTRLFSDVGMFFEVVLVLQRALRDNGPEVRLAVVHAVVVLLKAPDFPLGGATLDAAPAPVQAMLDLCTLALLRELPEIAPDEIRPRLGSYVTKPAG